MLAYLVEYAAEHIVKPALDQEVELRKLDHAATDRQLVHADKELAREHVRTLVQVAPRSLLVIALGIAGMVLIFVETTRLIGATLLLAAAMGIDRPIKKPPPDEG